MLRQSLENKHNNKRQIIGKNALFKIIVIKGHKHDCNRWSGQCHKTAEKLLI